ncbi:MAG: hypothetical protein M1820_006197 [Bogoriella megaspora]|nr:MAG: hypothetical protein M1820_006197 [Bogoriella megaspora]
MLTVHHLNCSQSERIVWLCEELDLNYNLVHHYRDPILSPASLKDLPGNLTGSAPFIEDDDPTAGKKVAIGESGAIVEYIIHKHGAGRFALKSNDPLYADYLYWFHFANAGLQASMNRTMMIAFANLPPDSPVGKIFEQRHASVLRQVDNRLKDHKYLVGDELTSADIMSVYSLSTQRYWSPHDLSDYPNIVRWLQTCGDREGYKRAAEKGDPGLERLLGAKAPEKSGMELGKAPNA